MKTRVWSLETATGPSLTKIGGRPVPVGVLRWPTCATCQAPMAFLFQLTATPGILALPPGVTSLHVFQCESGEPECAQWEPFSGANAVIATGGPPAPATFEGATPPEPMPEQPLRAVPVEEDTEALSIDMDTAPFEALGRRDEAAAKAPPSKLGGVPVWLQGPATPECCGEPMTFLAQVDAEPWGLPFGDGGRGFLFQCAKPCSETPYRFLWQSA